MLPIPKGSSQESCLFLHPNMKYVTVSVGPTQSPLRLKSHFIISPLLSVGTARNPGFIALLVILLFGPLPRSYRSHLVGGMDGGDHCRAFFF